MIKLFRQRETLATWILRTLLAGLLLLVEIANAEPSNAALPSIQKVFDQHSAIMLLIDPASGQIIDANPAASRFYGYSQQQLQTMKIQQINTLTQEEVAAERAHATEQQRNFFVFRHQLSNGEVRTVEVSSVPFVFDDKPLLFSIVNDVSELRETQAALWHYQTQLEGMVDRQTEALREGDERLITLLLAGSLVLLFTVLVLLRLLIKRRQAEAALTLEQKRLEEIIRGTNVGTWEWQVESGDIALNERWANVVGYELHELKTLTIQTRLDLIHPDDRIKSDMLIGQLFRHELHHYECEIRLKHKEGHWVWVMERGNVVEWSDSGKPLRMSGTHQDISRRKAADAQIQYQAKYDALTGLPNRVLFLERCEAAISAASRTNDHVALLFIDLNKFKPINDTRGHEAGDQVLQEIAARLGKVVREGDTVARFGGDEFVILLTGLHSPEPISRIAHQIIEHVAEPCPLSDGDTVSVSASVGVALYPDDGPSIDALLRNADFAMYAAKRGDQGFVVYASEVSEYACQLQ